MKKTTIYIITIIVCVLALGIYLSYGWVHAYETAPKDLIIDEIEHDFYGDVIIVGAGASGLAAATLLEKYDISYKIIEATDRYGGRIKKDETLADFPIDLGAEWIHQTPDILDRLVEAHTQIETINYEVYDAYNWDGESLEKEPAINTFLLSWSYPESKFKKTTWFDYIETYFAKKVEDKILYNAPVTNIDYSGDKVRVQIQNNEVHEADKIIVTVPIGVLQKGYIGFTPELPDWKYEAFDSVEFFPGYKLFMKFDKKFYPDGIYIDTDEGEKAYYDVAFGKNSTSNILGLLHTGPEVTTKDRSAILTQALQEIDSISDGLGSKHFTGEYLLENWGQRKFTQGTWTNNSDEDEYLQDLIEPIEDTIYFAGETYNRFNQRSTVHGAIISGYTAVYDMLGVEYE